MYNMVLFSCWGPGRLLTWDFKVLTALPCIPALEYPQAAVHCLSRTWSLGQLADDENTSKADAQCCDT